MQNTPDSSSQRCGNLKCFAAAVVGQPERADTEEAAKVSAASAATMIGASRMSYLAVREHGHAASSSTTAGLYSSNGSSCGGSGIVTRSTSTRVGAGSETLLHLEQ